MRPLPLAGWQTTATTIGARRQRLSNGSSSTLPRRASVRTGVWITRANNHPHSTASSIHCEVLTALLSQQVRSRVVALPTCAWANGGKLSLQIRTTGSSIPYLLLWDIPTSYRCTYIPAPQNQKYLPYSYYLCFQASPSLCTYMPNENEYLTRLPPTRSRRVVFSSGSCRYSAARWMDV